MGAQVRETRSLNRATKQPAHLVARVVVAAAVQRAPRHLHHRRLPCVQHFHEVTDAAQVADAVLDHRVASGQQGQRGGGRNLRGQCRATVAGWLKSRVGQQGSSSKKGGNCSKVAT